MDNFHDEQGEAALKPVIVTDYNWQQLLIKGTEKLIAIQL
jgi:hypothetical protein